jgi:hypothetical protein
MRHRSHAAAIAEHHHQLATKGHALPGAQATARLPHPALRALGPLQRGVMPLQRVARAVLRAAGTSAATARAAWSGTGNSPLLPQSGLGGMRSSPVSGHHVLIFWFCVFLVLFS